MFPEIKPGLDRLPPQMKAEAALLLFEAGRSAEAVIVATGVSPAEARGILEDAGPFRRCDDFNSSAPNGGAE